MGMQPIWRTKQKKCSLLGSQIYRYSHVKISYCSVLQIGCISMDVQGVYKDSAKKKKKAIRAISSESWNKHTPPRFHQLKMLPLDIVILNTSLFMYDIYHKNLSETFLNMFTPLSSIHQHNTRKSKSKNF